MKLVTVIMAARNAEEFVLDSIESVLTQTYSELQLIVCDDNSDDSTYRICTNIEDKRVIVLRNGETRGPGPSRNRCLEHATGDYIAVMDADDVSRPSRIEKQVAFLEKHKNVVACGMGFKRFGEREGIPRLPLSPQAIWAHLLFTLPVCHPSLMVRAELIQVHGIAYPPLQMAQDYGFIAAISRLGPIQNLREVGLDYRVRGESLSHKNRHEHRRCVRQIYTEHLSFVVGRRPTSKELDRHELLAGRRCPTCHLYELNHAAQWIFVLLRATRNIHVLLNGGKRWAAALKRVVMGGKINGEYS